MYCVMCCDTYSTKGSLQQTNVKILLFAVQKSYRYCTSAAASHKGRRFVLCSKCVFHPARQWMEACQCVDHADSQHLSFHAAHQPSVVHVGAPHTHSPSPLVHQTAFKDPCV